MEWPPRQTSSSWAIFTAIRRASSFVSSLVSMSALPPKADISRAVCDVCFVPKADIGRAMALPSAAFLACPPWDKDQRV
jgi:hypothetical protein